MPRRLGGFAEVGRELSIGLDRAALLGMSAMQQSTSNQFSTGASRARLMSCLIRPDQAFSFCERP
jgi:hypothetical protein